MRILLFLLLITPVSGAVSYSEILGAPTPYGTGLQPAGSDIQSKIINLYDFLLYISIAICVLVSVVMLYICFRYSEKRNPKPAKFSHNTPIEIIWTVIPCLIVAIILWKSWNFYYEVDDTSNADMTVKIVGHQWYWGYEYPDHGNIEFEARIVKGDDLKDKSLRLLDTDEKLVLPVGKKIRLLITASDVIHSWYVPALGVKKDAVPGKTNEAWVNINKKGDYYGVCAEICGVDHGFMPIAVKAVSQEDFDTWVKQKQQEAGLKQHFLQYGELN